MNTNVKNKQKTSKHIWTYQQINTFYSQISTLILDFSTNGVEILFGNSNFIYALCKSTGSARKGHFGLNKSLVHDHLPLNTLLCLSSLIIFLFSFIRLLEHLLFFCNYIKNKVERGKRKTIFEIQWLKIHRASWYVTSYKNIHIKKTSIFNQIKMFI